MENFNSNKNNFKTPKYFFDELEKNIISQTIEKSNTKTIPLYKKPIVWLSSAAAVLLLIVLINPFSRNVEITPQDRTIVQETIYNLYLDEEVATEDTTTVYDEYVYLIE